MPKRIVWISLIASTPGCSRPTAERPPLPAPPPNVAAPELPEWPSTALRADKLEGPGEVFVLGRPTRHVDAGTVLLPPALAEILDQHLVNADLLEVQAADAIHAQARRDRAWGAALVEALEDWAEVQVAEAIRDNAGDAWWEKWVSALIGAGIGAAIGLAVGIGVALSDVVVTPAAAPGPDNVALGVP